MPIKNNLYFHKRLKHLKRFKICLIKIIVCKKCFGMWHKVSPAKILDLNTLNDNVFFNVMASGGLYFLIYITIHSPNNYLCALDTTLRIIISQFCQFLKGCYWKEDRLFQNDEKFPCCINWLKASLQLLIKRWDSVYIYFIFFLNTDE